LEALSFSLGYTSVGLLIMSRRHDSSGRRGRRNSKPPPISCAHVVLEKSTETYYRNTPSHDRWEIEEVEQGARIDRHFI